MRALGKWILFLAVLAGLGVFIVWQTGGFVPKIKPPAGGPAVPDGLPGPALPVRRIQVPLIEQAVGTVQSRHRVDVSPQIQSTILEIKVNAGERVAGGALLARLDPRDLDSRVGQAEQAVQGAEAANTQAQADYARARELLRAGVMSPQEGGSARTRAEVTSATLGEARRALEQARVARSYAEIRSPVAGVVVEKHQQSGDMAQPGKPIVSLYDPTLVRLEAPVRETAVRGLRVGDSIEVRLGTEDRATTGVIDEIVPQADVATRSILVKVLIPNVADLYSGMYGRLLIRTGTESVLVVPAYAVRRVGQLEFVRDGEAGQQRFVQTGRAFGDDLEVLSGLDAGGSVLRPETIQ